MVTQINNQIKPSTVKLPPKLEQLFQIHDLDLKVRRAIGWKLEKIVNKHQYQFPGLKVKQSFRNSNKPSFKVCRHKATETFVAS